MRKSIFLCMLIGLMSIPIAGFAQSQAYSGSVVSAEDNQPLIGATLLVKNTNIGTVTDFDGQFSIEASVGDTLQVSYIGYVSQDFVLGAALSVSIKLLPDLQQLDEVVVTGYGSQKRTNLTTSISKLDTRILETSTRSNAATALQGTVAGLRVTNTTGQPGSTPRIVMRGGTNFSEGDAPLILVDGIPSSFYALNSDDIESIEVLKDAAATAIYGARSANGVILITTKSGKKGKSSVNYKFKYSTNQERNDQQYLGAEDHINYNRQSIAWFREANNNPGAFGAFLDANQGAGTGNNATNDPFTVQLLTDANRYLLNQPGWQSIPDILDPSRSIVFYDNQGVGDRIYQNSFTQDHYLSFDGGNEQGTYYLGLGILDNDGLVLGSGFKRYSAKLSGSYKIAENLTVSANILYSHSNLGLSPLGSDDRVFRRFQGQAPTARTFDSNPDGTFSDVYAVGQNQGFGNPLYYRDKFVRNNLEQRLSAVAGFSWSIMDNLIFKVTGSHFTINNHNANFDKAYRVGSTSGPLRNTRNASVSLSRTLRNQLTGTLNYEKQIGKHNLNILAGSEYFSDYIYNTSAGTRNSPTDLIQTLNAGAEANGIPNSFETGYVLTSYFGRALYEYDNRFLLGLTFRNDGSSRLGNNKFDFFPGVSFGWNLHNEAFFANSGLGNVFDRFKPRVSYGVNGNQNVLSNFGVFGSYGSTGVYDGQTGYANSGLPILDLLWEKSTTFNVGFDISVLNNRLNIITDIYSRDIKDKLAPQLLPFYTGFSSITTNNGTLRNRGFELELNADLVRKGDLIWNFGATLTSNRNYVVQLPENDNELNRQGGTEIWNAATGQVEWVGGLQEGQRFGGDLIVAFIQEGIYSSQAEADADNEITDQYMPGFSRNRRWAGDVKWKDVNGDGTINYLDREVIGRTTPTLVGGFSNSVSYKNFSLYVKADFAVGHMVWNHIKNKGYAQTQGNLAQPEEVLESWTPDNPNAEWPRFVFVNGTRNVWRGNESSGSLQNYGNNKFWEKGDYLAIRELTLNYNVPERLLNNVVSRVNIFATGSNLHYFKSMSGDTPEIGGVQYGAFPLPKTYTFGVNVTF